MQKISILIPVYNGEKYIKRCLDSAFSQTYPNIEIIVIDDGCTDNTINIVKQYKNIKLYHNSKNMGVGFSRNLAIKKCETDLFIFLDSDDTLEKNCIELLYNKMISTNADIVMGSCDENLDEEIILEGDSKFDILFNRTVTCYMTLWNKLFRKEIFNSFNFPDTSFAEDEDAIHLILSNASKIVIIPQKTYNYYENENGLHVTTEKNYMIAIEAFYKRYLFFKNTKYDIPSWIALKKYIFSVMQLLIAKNKKIDHLKKYFFEHLKLKYIRYINVKEILFLMFPKLYMKIKQKTNYYT